MGQVSIPPSGQQWTISAPGDDQGPGAQAVITQVGGGIRVLKVGGEPVLFGYPLQSKADGGRGQLLMPWPNRIRDGRYSFDGNDQQLALSEPAKRNASHGLVRWALWTLQDQTVDALTVSYLLLPQQGWDASLQLKVVYRVNSRGLTVATRATNVGTAKAPFAYGAHPYLTTGEATVDEVTLQIPAGRALNVDDRLIPTGTTPVSGDTDFRQSRRVGSTVLDTAFTDLAPDDDGRWRVVVSRGERRTTLWADASTFGYVQAFTGDSLPPEHRRRTGLAVEPMSAPANAFVTGEALTVLRPGDVWAGTWGVTAG